VVVVNTADSPAVCTDIEKLIPHRAPMRLAQTIVAIEDEAIETISVVQDSWPTARHGQVRTLVLIEVIAQTAAALQGWRDRNHGEGRGGGLLVGVPEAKLHKSALPVGSRLRCFVHISHGAPNYLAFEGRVEDADGTRWLSGSIQAFRPDEPLLPGSSP
jgi:predicted hotdog family 3-hydroxylacyl-ACP dehydratase